MIEGWGCGLRIMNKGIVSSWLGHVYYICPDCGHWQSEVGAHQHQNGQWIQGSWLKEYYNHDKKSAFQRWDKVSE